MPYSAMSNISKRDYLYTGVNMKKQASGELYIGFLVFVYSYNGMHAYYFIVLFSSAYYKSACMCIYVYCYQFELEMFMSICT